MDTIVQIRQMMAEQKFYDAQKLIEIQLKLSSESRHELLKLYYDSLNSQHKIFPQDLALELAEKEILLKNFEFALNLTSSISADKYYIRIFKMKVMVLEEKGMMDELYNQISAFFIRQFEKQVPTIPDWLSQLVERYFRHDFNLKVKQLALTLLLNDVERSEVLIKELMISAVERFSQKGLSTKFHTLGEILKSGQNKGPLEIYQNYCLIYANGIQEKSDYKRIVEMVIYFEDFKIKVLLMNLMQKLGLEEMTAQYSVAVKESKDYSFVYFDKFFPHLKSYFVKVSSKSEPAKENPPQPDLKLTEKISREIISPDMENEVDEDEKKYAHLLKYQTYSASQLCDLSVSFLQSEMPGVALKASELAVQASQNDLEYLKASYMKLTCQLKLQDFRAAVDTCFAALTKAQTRDDVLSFMYGQAEAYIRLNQNKNAKTVLSKIISIDAKYRLAKERLDKLNEI